MKGKSRHFLAITLLIAGTLVWIWGNSLLPAEVSRGLSGALQSFIDRVLGIPPDTGGAGEGLLRKIAHMAEFAALGAEIAILFSLLEQKAERIAPALWILCGLVVAIIDEMIQLWTPGRAAMVQDVGIDMAGFAIGGGLFLLVYGLIYKIRTARRANT